MKKFLGLLTMAAVVATNLHGAVLSWKRAYTPDAPKTTVTSGFAGHTPQNLTPKQLAEREAFLDRQAAQAARAAEEAQRAAEARAAQMQQLAEQQRKPSIKEQSLAQQQNVWRRQPTTPQQPVTRRVMPHALSTRPVSVSVPESVATTGVNPEASPYEYDYEAAYWASAPTGQEPSEPSGSGLARTPFYRGLGSTLPRGVTPGATAPYTHTPSYYERFKSWLPAAIARTLPYSQNEGQAEYAALYGPQEEEGIQYRSRSEQLGRSAAETARSFGNWASQMGQDTKQWGAEAWQGIKNFGPDVWRDFKRDIGLTPAEEVKSRIQE